MKRVLLLIILTGIFTKYSAQTHEEKCDSLEKYLYDFSSSDWVIDARESCDLNPNSIDKYDANVELHTSQNFAPFPFPVAGNLSLSFDTWGIYLRINAERTFDELTQYSGIGFRDNEFNYDYSGQYFLPTIFYFLIF